MDALHERDVQVEDQSSLHLYRTEIPNMVEEMDLSVYAFRLYVRLKRVAGDGGKCFYTTPELAAQCRMSAGSISKAKAELVTARLITVERSDKWERDQIRIVDMWPANFAYFADKADKKQAALCSPHEQAHPNGRSKSGVPEAVSVHHMNAPVHVVNASVHVVNAKEEPYKERTNKEEPKGDCRPLADAPADAWAEFLGALCWICYRHQDTSALSAAQMGALAAEGKRMVQMGYTTDDLREWMTCHWMKTWQWEKGKQPPKPFEVRTSIPLLRARRDEAAHSAYAVRDYEPPDLPPALSPPEPPPEPRIAAGGVDPDALWAALLSELAHTMPAPTFDQWMRASTVESYADGAFVIALPTASAREWIENRLNHSIERSLGSLMRRDVRVCFTVRPTAETGATP